MPVEIEQLIINARVVDRSRETRRDMPSGEHTETAQRDLLERCVAEVLRVLRDRQER